MKKIRSLQILVYVVCGLLLVQGLVAGGWRGFKEGYNDAKYSGDDNFRQSEQLQTTLDGSYFTHNANGSLKVDDKYLFEDVNIIADLRVNDNKVELPYLVKIPKWFTILILVIIVCKVAYYINSVIQKIVDNSMFDREGIKLIKNIGLMMLLYTVIKLIYEELSYYEQTLLIQAPFKVVNTTTFHTGTLITAILVLIIAEAFKQGAILKEEQSLII